MQLKERPMKQFIHQTVEEVELNELVLKFWGHHSSLRIIEDLIQEEKNQADRFVLLKPDILITVITYYICHYLHPFSRYLSPLLQYRSGRKCEEWKWNGAAPSKATPSAWNNPLNLLYIALCWVSGIIHEFNRFNTHFYHKACAALSVSFCVHSNVNMPAKSYTSSRTVGM